MPRRATSVGCCWGTRRRWRRRGAFDSREATVAAQRPTLQITYTPPVAAITSTGTGCTGSGATPFTAAANGNPTLGNASFALTLIGGPLPLIQVFALAGAPSPFPIPFGAPGCVVLVNPLTIALTLPVVGGTAPLPIPGATILLGGEVYMQGIGVDAGTVLIVLSNALTLKIGQ